MNEALEQKSDDQEKPIEEAKGLPLREALEVALEATKDSQSEDVSQPAAKEEKEPAPVQASPLQPPAEWTKEEKEDFAASTPKQQEAALRLHNSRNSKLAELRSASEKLAQERAETEWAREIVRDLTPFLKTRGEKRPAHEVVSQAVRLVNEIDGAPIQAVIDVLKARGQKEAAELLEKSHAPEKKSSGEDLALRKELEEVKSKISSAEESQVVSSLVQQFDIFAASKNAAGKNRFPGLDDSEKGVQLVGNMGALLRGRHPDSTGFHAYLNARHRNGYGPQTALFEAYRWFGGAVDDSEATKTQSDPKHIKNAQRAASSVPGRGGNPTSNGTAKKYKSYREALEAAVEQLGE